MTVTRAEKMRTIAYNMDLLLPGVYLWLGSVVLKLGGREPDDVPHRYPGTVNSRYGIAIVVPGAGILTSYKGSYDPS
jgi:hypothetical protein